MRFLDPDGMVSLIGLLAQTGITWTLTLIFALLLRPSGRPGFFVDWTRGLLCIAIGLTAVTCRYYLPLMSVELGAVFRDDSAASRSLLLIYQLGKCFGSLLFLSGTLRLTQGAVRARTSRWMFPAAAGYAAVTSVLSTEVEQVLFWQSLITVPLLFAAGALLWRRPRERRDHGVRITATALQLDAALWVLYGLLTATHLAGLSLVTQRGTIPHTFLSYNSYFDLAMTVATASGMIVLLMLDLQHASRAAQEERARLELQLERGERLRALGALVSSVAHDLNNPLTAVLGFAAELERGRQGTDDGQAARIVREQAERCRSIVQRLSALVGDHPVRRRLVDPAEVAERVARGARQRFAEAGVAIELRVSGALPALYADPFGLEEVLDNLLDNARQASPRGGRIHLGLGVEQGMVAFRVRDEGRGVPEALRARIFDPFFSLRTDGQGTGLGLSVARGIVKAHAGRIELEEPDGQPGAAFLVLLPPARPEVLPISADEVEHRAVLPEPQRAERRILVVDDERLVRRVLRRWLQHAGWQVEECENGAEALEQLRGDPLGYAAVLCDLRMPRPTGYELHDRLATELPEVLARTIFITGDLASPEAAAFSARCSRPIVRKPFDFEELDATLAKLDSEPRWRVSAGALGALALCLPFLTACGDAAPADARNAPAAPAQPDAPALFAQHCAPCHGAAGAGDGSVVLDRPARSLRDGGFSFGNTEEAIFRTITSGIGGTPMPGFARLLTEAERRAVARQVIALGPEQVPAPGAASVLVVGARPVVVRGQFAPLVPGGPEHPRGLLVGNPDGLSYQYRADDLRLLAVRQGPFVDRKDWGERGGLPLEPLGRLIHLTEDRAEWETPAGAGRAVLLATRTDGATAVLRYRVEDARGTAWAVVEERAQASGRRAASGYLREFIVEALQDPAQPRFRAPTEAAGMMVWMREEAAEPARRLLLVETLFLPQDTAATRQALREELGR